LSPALGWGWNRMMRGRSLSSFSRFATSVRSRLSRIYSRDPESE
jgi:hypothetical protein